MKPSQPAYDELSMNLAVQAVRHKYKHFGRVNLVSGRFASYAGALIEVEVR
jgi:hypothetical protein